MDSVTGESGAVIAVVWQYDGYGIQHGGSGVVTSGHDALQEKDLFGLLGTSILGGVSHNAGQIAMAALLMKSGNIMLYMPVLCISGTIAGVCIGLAGAVLVRKLPSIEY